MEMRYDNRSADDLQRVADALMRVPEDTRRTLAAGIMAFGLLNTHWWVRLIVRLLRARFRCSTQVAWYIFFGLTKDGPKLINLAIADTKMQLLHGDDLTDVESAGGFSLHEVNVLANLLTRLGTDPTAPSRHIAA